MYINDKKLSKLLQDKPEANNHHVTVFLLDHSKTISITLTRTWERIEYLSLRNNYIKDVSFIHYFPMLYYLDLTENPIEDFELFNKYNSYAYLGLTSPQNFLERNILVLKGLNIGILEFEIQNQEFKEQFIKHNPNVFYFNGHCYGFNEKKALINKADTSNDKTISMNSSSKQTITHRNNTNGNNNSNFINLRERFNVINNNIRNTTIKDLLDFIENYNKEMLNCINDTPDTSPIKVKEQKEERKCLLLLCNIYKQITQYQNIPDNTLYYNKSLKLIHKRKGICYYKINLKLFQLKNIPMQLLILSIIYLYIIGIFSKQFCIEILYSFHIKLNTQVLSSDSSYETLKEDLQCFFNMEYFYIICFYYDIYMTFSAVYKELKISEKEDERNKIDYGAIRYNDLRKSLKMLKLTMLIPQLEIHQKNTGSLLNIQGAVTRNELIQSIILNFLLQKKIYKETLQIVQFVNDFLLINKYESILVKDLANDYRLFHEIKEQLYKSTRNIHDSLSEKKYNEIKMKTLANKYFFKSNQYIHLTSIGSQLNRFYISQKPTFYPVKPTPHYNNPNWNMNEEEENEIKKTVKLNRDLQNTLFIKSEKKKANERKCLFPQTQLYKKNLIVDKPIITNDYYNKHIDYNGQKLQLKEPFILKDSESTSSIATNKPITMEIQSVKPRKLVCHNLFYNKEMEKGKSQSVTCLFSKTKKLPKLQLEPFNPKYDENNTSINNNLKLLSIDKQNKISFRLNAKQKKDCSFNSNTVDSFIVLEPKYKY